MMHSNHNNNTSSGATTTSSSSTSPPGNADSKILTDLSTLSEQIELCQSMLGASTYPHTSNEALLAVIGFLEACVPRMVELVDAAAQGALHEETLERCLEVNDALLKTLSNFDDPEYRGGGGTAAASSGSGSGSEEGIAGDLDDLLLDDSGTTTTTTTAKTAMGGGKSTGEEKAASALKDPFAGEPDVLQPTPSSTVTAKKDDDDEFDAFLKERTG